MYRCAFGTDASSLTCTGSSQSWSPLEPMVRIAVIEVCERAVRRLSSKPPEEHSAELLSISDEIITRAEYLDRELLPAEFGTAEQLMELATEAENRRAWEEAAVLHRCAIDEILIRREQLSRLDTDDPDDDLAVDRALIPDERLRAGLFTTANRLASVEVRRDRLPEALGLHMSFATKDAPTSSWDINEAEIATAEARSPTRARELWRPRALLAYERIACSAYLAAVVGQADVLMRMGIVAPAVAMLMEVTDKGHEARSSARADEAREWWSSVRDTITNATFPVVSVPESFLAFRHKALPDVHRLLGDLEYSERNRWSALVSWAQAAELGDPLAASRLSQHDSSVEAVRAEAVARATGRFV